MPEKVLQVLVVGGGIGGLCLAQGLRKAGIQVKVFERDRTVDARLDRYRLHINPAGTRALRACLPDEVWDRFLAAVGRPGGGFLFLDEQLHELLSIEDSLMYPASDDSAERAYPVERRALRDVLLTDLADVVQFGKRFERYELQPNGGVTAWFTDGSRADGDLLVGADGSASQVRAQLLPRAKPDDTGAVGFGAKLPLTAQTRAWLPPELLDGETMIMTGDPFFLFTSVFQTLGEPDGTSSYLLCAFVARKDACPPGIADMDGPSMQRAIANLASGWHPILRQLILTCDPTSVAMFPFATLLPPDWPTGQVTLLGDAIHLMPPTGGIGANTTMRDASLLTRQLVAVATGQCDLAGAMKGYEGEMREYGAAAVRSALTTLRQGLNTNPVKLTGTRAFFRVCRAIAPLRRVSFRDYWARHTRPRPWEESPSAAVTPARWATGD
jgi:2-polyprenyl-6-methoxyphenol hydroxylase-like FAD-dependent oxidoreductase